MTTQTELTQLKFVYRNGAPDTAFVLAVKRQQAARTIKRALRASMKLTGRGIAELSKCIELNAYDAAHGTKLRHEYELMKQAERDEAMRARYFKREAEKQERARERNVHGQFIAA